MREGIRDALGIALVALVLAAVALILQLRSDEMTLAAHGHAVLDQMSVVAKSGVDYSSQQQRVLRGWEGMVNAFIIQTNCNMNGGPRCPRGTVPFLPTLTKTVADENGRLATTHGKLDDGLVETKAGMQAATKALNNAADLLGDQNIKRTVASVADTSDNVKGITGSIKKDSDESVVQMQEITKMLKDAGFYIHKHTHPTKKDIVVGMTWQAFITWLTHPFW